MTELGTVVCVVILVVGAALVLLLLAGALAMADRADGIMDAIENELVARATEDETEDA